MEYDAQLNIVVIICDKDGENKRRLKRLTFAASLEMVVYGCDVLKMIAAVDDRITTTIDKDRAKFGIYTANLIVRR